MWSYTLTDLLVRPESLCVYVVSSDSVKGDSSFKVPEKGSVGLEGMVCVEGDVLSTERGRKRSNSSHSLSGQTVFTSVGHGTCTQTLCSVGNRRRTF